MRPGQVEGLAQGSQCKVGDDARLCLADGAKRCPPAGGARAAGTGPAHPELCTQVLGAGVLWRVSTDRFPKFNISRTCFHGQLS